MITDLPDGFKKSINAQHRKPVMLALLHFGSKICPLSDAPAGPEDGLLFTYEPIIESWGVIKDTSDLDSSFSGNSLEIKSMQLSIIVDNNSKFQLLEAMNEGLDNSVVEIYQWFHDTPFEAPQLIDVMVIQDPINYSEKSMLLKIDLVSILLKNNPYLWAREPGEETRDIVVGKMEGMPLYNQQTSRVTALSQDLEFDYTGQVFIDNGVGFRAGPDTMTIDSEIVAYDWISASAMNITGRAQGGTTARPHIRGALICHPDAVFDYSICAGPVQTVDNLIGNGEPYTQPVTFYPGQDPVIARFIGRPPWLKVSPGVGGPPITPDPETSTEYGNNTESTYGEGAGAPSSSGSINSSSGASTMAIASTVGGGAGSVFKSKTTPSESVNIEDFPTSTELYGTGSMGSSFGTYGSAVVFEDDIKGHIDQIYGATETGLGTLTGLTAGVEFSLCSVKRAEGTVNVYFIKANGSSILLDTDTQISTDAFSKSFKFSNKISYYDVKNHVSNFSELAQCRIRVECVNINSLNGNSTEGIQVKFQTVQWDIDYFIEAGSVPSPWQQLYSHFNRDLSSYGGLTGISVQVRFNASITNAQVYQAVVFNGSIMWSRSISGSQGAATVIIYPNITSFSSLKNAKIGVYQQIVGPETEGVNRQLSTSFEYVKWVITYQPGQIETPDEERVVYAEDLICDVTSMIGENPTPAEVIANLIEDHSTNGAYLDLVSFNARHEEYNTDLYYFNGVLKGDIRLHDAIRQCLREGMARLLFSQGSIGLLNYSTYENIDVDYSVGADEYCMKSKAQKNQPTSTIVNDVDVLFDYNPAADTFEGKFNIVNSNSISRFERQQKRTEYSLIRSEDIAEKIGQYSLDRLSTPITVLSFDVFMSGYVLQKGDRIHFNTMFEGYKAVGHIASIDRVTASYKNNQLNKYRIQIADSISTTKFLNLNDYILVEDFDLELGGATTRLNLSEAINIRDSKIFKNLHLGFVENIIIDDSHATGSVSKVLLLSDSIQISEALSSKRSIALKFNDSIVIDDSIFSRSMELALADSLIVNDSNFEASTAIRIRLLDSIKVEDSNFTKKRKIHLQLTDNIIIDDSGISASINSGYGEGGYGDKPYGE